MLVPAVANAINFVRDHWPEISGAITDSWTQVKPALDSVISIVKLVSDTVEQHWGTIKRNMTALQTVMEDSLKAVRDALKLVDDLLHGNWTEAWKDAKAIVGDVIDGIKTLLVNQLENVKAGALAIGRGVKTAFVDGVTGTGNTSSA